MTKRPQLTIERLKDALDYDPDTGVFTWKIKQVTAYPGKVVTVLANNANQPYLYVCLDGRRHYAHRLAWFYMTGEWPPVKVDHRNGIHDDNRWRNLRLATNKQNSCNTKLRKDNKAGLKGVCFVSDKKRWKAQINSKHLGYFDTPEEAHAVYVNAAKQSYGEFFRQA